MLKKCQVCYLIRIIKLPAKFLVFQYATSSSNKRRVYVWGNAKTGALGVPKLKKRESFDSMKCILYPKRLSFAERYQVLNEYIQYM